MLNIMKRSGFHFAILGIVAIVAGVVMFSSAQTTETSPVTLARPAGLVKGVDTQAQVAVVISGLPQPITEGLDNIPTNGATALDLLTYVAQKNSIELKTKDYGEMGTLVESIGAVTNGTDNKYWAYYVNGALGQVAADQYQLKAGDVIEFRFEKSNF